MDKRHPITIAAQTANRKTLSGNVLQLRSCHLDRRQVDASYLRAWTQETLADDIHRFTVSTFIDFLGINAHITSNPGCHSIAVYWWPPMIHASPTGELQVASAAFAVVVGGSEVAHSRKHCVFCLKKYIAKIVTRTCYLLVDSPVFYLCAINPYILFFF